ncbi:MAG: DUF3106 domain-containing protein [Comamonadaceae bacterium]|nr:MAG: DUF3106 domain-containing protein [Comamonadaceae bacterium]
MQHCSPTICRLLHSRTQALHSSSRATRASPVADPSSTKRMGHLGPFRRSARQCGAVEPRSTRLSADSWVAAAALTLLLAGPVAAESGRSGAGRSITAGESNTTLQLRASSWAQLTPMQRASLAPLEGHWSTMSEAQKRKWIALSGNYTSLTPDERRTLHSRMTEWATLSPRDRAQARLNFAEVKQVSPEERKAKWAAYQALSDDERRKLADRASERPRSAAIPIRPIPAQKLVEVPGSAGPGEHGARIRLAAPSERPRGVSMPMPASVPAPPMPDASAPTESPNIPPASSPLPSPASDSLMGGPN